MGRFLDAAFRCRNLIVFNRAFSTSKIYYRFLLLVNCNLFCIYRCKTIQYPLQFHNLQRDCTHFFDFEQRFNVLMSGSIDLPPRPLNSLNSIHRIGIIVIASLSCLTFVKEYSSNFIPSGFNGVRFRSLGSQTETPQSLFTWLVYVNTPWEWGYFP